MKEIFHRVFSLRISWHATITQGTDVSYFGCRGVYKISILPAISAPGARPLILALRRQIQKFKMARHNIHSIDDSSGDVIVAFLTVRREHGDIELVELVEGTVVSDR
jgi:hypothetical protein